MVDQQKPEPRSTSACLHSSQPCLFTNACPLRDPSTLTSTEDVGAWKVAFENRLQAVLGAGSQGVSGFNV